MVVSWSAVLVPPLRPTLVRRDVLLCDGELAGQFGLVLPPASVPVSNVKDQEDFNECYSRGDKSSAVYY